MSRRGTAALLALACTLAVFLWFEGGRGGRAREAEALAGDRLFGDLEAADVSALSLRRSGEEELSAVRVAGGWRITRPIDFPASASAFDAMAASLASLSAAGRLTEPAALDVYGLVPTARTVEFVAHGASQGLVIGREAPVGGQVYVARATGGEISPVVVMVAAWTLRAFDSTLDALRESRVFPVEPERVRAITLSVREAASDERRTIRLERDIDVGWRIAAPPGLEADRDAVDALLASLSGLRAHRFVDHPPLPSVTGLSEAGYEVVLEEAAPAEDDASPGEAHALRLSIGHVASASDGVADGEPFPSLPLRYAKGSEKALYLVPAAQLDSLPRDAQALRQKQLSRFLREEAERVELVFTPGGGTSETSDASEARVPVALVLVRSPRTDDSAPVWRLDGAPADDARVAALLGALSALDATGILADALGPAELHALGLSPAELSVRVYGAPDAAGESRMLADLAFGRAGPTAPVRAQRAGRDEVYELPGAFAEALPISREIFRTEFTRAVSGP